MTYAEYLRTLADHVARLYEGGGLCMFLDANGVWEHGRADGKGLPGLNEPAHEKRLRDEIDIEITLHGKGYAYLVSAWLSGSSLGDAVKPNWMTEDTWGRILHPHGEEPYRDAKRDARVEWLRYLASIE